MASSGSARGWRSWYGRGVKQLRLRVNETVYEVEAEPSMPLLWVLRDLLGLTGTKFGCGIGQCRACTVHLDGAAVPSCQLPISAVNAEATITTIEGLAGSTQGPSERKLHVLQQAWLDAAVPQCGYCQSGQLMSAAALLNTNPKPNDEDIDAAMRGNLCRCGTYQRIRSAIHAAVAGDAEPHAATGGGAK